ncbi:MAG TPA: lytic transglycosylase domain-containing protein [Candidatus Elarobacter sp.]|jgi:soluble lytic murein transglycosylase-like protein|nr:lytic transglycosylase domain-containing protein [Candidatus Elarobacter sp.]
MFGLSTRSIAAAFFVFSTAALAVAAPASAQTAPVATASEAAYAAVLHTLNPQLPMDKARAYARSVMKDAWKTHLDARFIMSIVTVESRWRANAVSRVGARGLGQLMPGTARTLGVNPRNPSDNLRGTSTYLKSLMDHFAGKPNAMKLAIAGYNAGPKAVERYHGVPPYAETQHYVVRVLRVWNTLNTRVGKALAPAPDAAIAIRAPKLPDEQQWLSSDTNEILPATAAAVDSVPNPALTAGPSPNAAASAQPSEAGK